MVNASSLLASVPVDLSATGSAALTSADVDGNGSRDLLLLNPGTLTLLRNTHGNPPLLAITTVALASVVGGATTQATGHSRRSGARQRRHSSARKQESDARILRFRR